MIALAEGAREDSSTSAAGAPERECLRLGKPENIEQGDMPGIIMEIISSVA